MAGCCSAVRESGRLAREDKTGSAPVAGAEPSCCVTAEGRLLPIRTALRVGQPAFTFQRGGPEAPCEGCREDGASGAGGTVCKHD